MTSGAGGDQTGARLGPFGNQFQPGFSGGASGTTDQVGTVGLPAVDPLASGEPADQPGLVAVPVVSDSPDQAGRAEAQNRPRAKPKLWRSKVFTGIEAMLLKGCWLQPLSLGALRCWGLEPLLV